MIIFLLAAEAGDLRYGKPISCSFYSSKDQAKSRGEFRRRWASIQPDILLTGLLFVSLQKQNLFIWKIKALFRCAQYGQKRLAEEYKRWGGVMEWRSVLRIMWKNWVFYSAIMWKNRVFYSAIMWKMGRLCGGLCENWAVLSVDYVKNRGVYEVDYVKSVIFAHIINESEYG